MFDYGVELGIDRVRVALINVTHYFMYGSGELVQADLLISLNRLCTMWIFLKLLSLALRMLIFPFSLEITP
jgi:hypothetical protein